MATARPDAGEPANRRSDTAVLPSWALALPLALAACSSSAIEGSSRQAGWVEDGEPVPCITTRQIRSMQIIDDRTILFEMNNRLAYRNDMPFRCPDLSFERAIRHNSRTSQLCSVNTVTPRSPGGGWRGPGCPLGMFQPMARAPVPAAPTP